MTVKIMVFGLLAEITGTGNFEVNDVRDTDNLNDILQERYPALRNMKYSVAVDKMIIDNNTKLENNSTVALMPPFSGG